MSFFTTFRNLQTNTTNSTKDYSTAKCSCTCCINSECRDTIECYRIILIIGCSVLGVLLIAILLCICLRKRKKIEDVTK